MARFSLRPVFIAVAVYVAIYVGLDFNKLYALRYGADLGTFVQTIVNMWHGSSWNYGEWRPHLEVHDSWLLFALAPLLTIFPRTETLVVVQVVAVAAAAIPLAIFGREIGLPARTANIVAIAYLLTPSAQGFSYDNFSENVFVPLIAFCGAVAVRRRSLWGTLAAAQLLMGLKEDEIFFAGWLAVACALFWDRRLGVAVLALAAVNGALYYGIEHALGTRSNAPEYAFGIEDVGGKLTLIALLLAPFAFAPLATGRWLLLALPFLVEIVFAHHNPYEPSRIGTHYTAPLLALTAVAASFGVRKAPGFTRAIVPCALVVTLFVFNDTALRPGRWPFLIDWAAYARAIDVRNTTNPVLLGRRDEGVWAVAAVNPLVRLDQRPDPNFVACPGYNTNAAAFFSSIGIGPRREWKLCGGVPVTENAAR